MVGIGDKPLSLKRVEITKLLNILKKYNVTGVIDYSSLIAKKYKDDITSRVDKRMAILNQ